MVTCVLAATGDVVTVNAANPCPAGTVTLAGTCAAAVLLLFSVTTAPPDGAAALSVSETCRVLPPLTPLTFGVSDARTGGAFGSGLTLRNTDFDRSEEHTSELQSHSFIS